MLCSACIRVFLKLASAAVAPDISVLQIMIEVLVILGVVSSHKHSCSPSDRFHPLNIQHSQRSSIFSKVSWIKWNKVIYNKYINASLNNTKAVAQSKFKHIRHFSLSSIKNSSLIFSYLPNKITIN